MDAKYFDEIKAREQAATPGPWNRIEHKRGRLYVGTGKKPIADICNLYYTESEANLAFISHARTDIPALIAEVERRGKKYQERGNAYRNLFMAFCEQQKQVATLKKALEIASEEVNTAFETLVSHGVLTMEHKASNVQENVDTWMQRAQQAGKNSK